MKLLFGLFVIGYKEKRRVMVLKFVATWHAANAIFLIGSLVTIQSLSAAQEIQRKPLRTVHRFEILDVTSLIWTLHGSGNSATFSCILKQTLK